MRVRRLLLTATLAVMCPTVALAKVKARVTAPAETPDELHKKARAKMKQLDFEAAVPLLTRLVALPELPPARKAEVLIDLGVCQVNMGEAANARQSFGKALELDGTVRLPETSAPKVQAVFTAAKEERAPPPSPPPPPPAVTDAPRAEPVVAPVVTTTPVAPPIVEQAPAAAVPGATIALGIVAAAALGGGIFTGLQSRRAAADLMGGLHTTDEVEALMRKQKLMGTLSLVGYGVSGAAAVGAVVTFFALRAKPGSVTVSASVGPDGALVMAGARF